MEEEVDEKRQNNNIVGLNLLILVAYTILSKLIAGISKPDAGFVGGPLLDAGFIAVHFLVCFIVAIEKRKWIWVLSGLVVLLVGASTCAEILSR